MNRALPVSVVLSTRNRATLLGPSIDSLLRQQPGTPEYEVLVVDNGSTDDTPAVVASRTEASGGRVRYVFEPQAGLSFARNAGTAAACSGVVAFTDDDVRVASDWVRVIHETFGAHPAVACLGGRTLPLWPTPPPAWLTRRHWVGPLALQDYGDEPLVVDATRPRCLAGANFAFRRGVLERLGGFSPDFPRGQDTEFLLRFYRAGERAMYVPRMLVHARVQPDRLTKAYHRRWHSNIGRFNALMQFEELAHPELGLRREVPPLRRVCGVPAFAVRLLAEEAWQWLKHAAIRDEAEAFLHENRARSLIGYMRAARELRLHRTAGSQRRIPVGGLR